MLLRVAYLLQAEKTARKSLDGNKDTQIVRRALGIQKWKAYNVTFSPCWKREILFVFCMIKYIF